MYFQSRDLRYRAPFGAVTAGTPVHLRIKLPRWLGCSAAFLTVSDDGGSIASDGMFWCGMEGEHDEWWECHYTPDTPGIYVYAFSLETVHGKRFLSCCEDGSADMCEDPGEVRRWQLTCYDDAQRPPDWIFGGVYYQIFPDRFAASGEPKRNVPDDRVLRGEEWGGVPAWEPDAQGKILNNDYFCGDLKGICRRLDRLAELGVTCLYLNPIFEAHSNHRYNTADYEKIDPLLGDADDFRELCAACATLGIRVVLDGVFSHTGSDSRYFNKCHRYAETGAANATTSPYAPWYRFTRWPQQYKGWWGFDTLPEVDEMCDSYRRYMLGDDGIVPMWMKAGASGWRLDVADELPDGFLEELYAVARRCKPDSLIIGEVWEDASCKSSYGFRRKYLLGGQLDSVTNYPFKEAILGFLTQGDTIRFQNRIMAIVEHYPPHALHAAMNVIGTHDTERALTVLGGEPAAGRGRRWQSQQRLSEQQRRHGLLLMRLAAVLQYCLPGVPCIYYGDEAGVEGYRDPFNRACYPWGGEDVELLLWYRKLGQLRRSHEAFKTGSYCPVACPEGVAAFTRVAENGAVFCAVNREHGEHTVILPPQWHGYTPVLGNGWVENDILHLSPLGCAMLCQKEE